ncbi:MAG: hypothetical protein GYA17_06160 [Chloroflexi bacterium]|nr:FIST N-terminal domain-containing protein [Anaerolineaceae bacterium]NMB87922.1 hypothetical protein [Chloroflexota bacterium]
MSPNVAIGIGTGLNGRQAAIQAGQQALDRLAFGQQPALGIVFVSEQYNFEEVASGLAALFGSLPRWGFSTVAPLNTEGELPRAVLVLLLAGKELKPQVQWWPAPDQGKENSQISRRFYDSFFREADQPGSLLFCGDGVMVNGQDLARALEQLSIPAAGGLASGDYHTGKTYQLGNNHYGTGSLSAVRLNDHFCIGSACAHGWEDIGIYFQVTRQRGAWLHTLDGRPVAEVYARYFRYPARDWAYPPLTDLVRLYPLGIETGRPEHPLALRSALHVEVDGSFRFNAPVDEGSMAHLLVGSKQLCLERAREAARGAVAATGGARPWAALVLVDLAWRYLFENHMEAVMAAVQEVVGDIPLAGAYTLGQIYRNSPPGEVIYENQALMVSVIGELTGE